MSGDRAGIIFADDENGKVDDSLLMKFLNSADQQLTIPAFISNCANCCKDCVRSFLVLFKFAKIVSIDWTILYTLPVTTLLAGHSTNVAVSILVRKKVNKYN